MVVEINGSILEGGGQILRISVALSVLCKLPVRIQNIRGNRKKSGLAAQHLTGIRLARDLCQAHLENDALGSSDITFTPGDIRNGKFIADTQTGGSVALLLQVALPCILFGPGFTQLTLKGGTNADFAPQIDYVMNVFKPMLQKFGADFECEIIKRGFIQGNGVINISVNPVTKLVPINLVDFGTTESIQGEAFVSGVLPLKMADEMAYAAQNALKNSVHKKISIKSRKFSNHEAFGNGSGINIFAKTRTGCILGSSNLGKKGVSTHEVGVAAAEILLESLNKKYCVDSKLQDQIILLMALADGISRARVGPITSHTETAIHITQMLTNARFNILKVDDCTNIIECEGIGLKNKYF